MEWLLFLGLAALVVLLALGAFAYLRQRRNGTVLAVSVPARALARSARQASTRHTERTASGHR